MTDDFNEPVRKIVDNYLNRLKRHLKKLPVPDQEEFMREIYSHIYESFRRDEAEDDIERIFNVLDRLGEPSEVVVTRVAGGMKRIGKKRRLPLYILAGIVIGLFGIPLGLGGFAVLLGLGITLAALIFCYYVVAGCLLLAGWVTFVVTFIRLFAPEFLIDHIHTMDQFLGPPWSVMVNFGAAVFCVLVGLGMFKLGGHILKGTRFLFDLPRDAIRRLLPRRRSRHEAESDIPVKRDPGAEQTENELSA
jgi:uncharacterized membrane protein